MADILETYVVELPEQATALLNPLRGEILSHLTEPASAAEVARRMNEMPQRINYHLKTLEKVGLVRRVGTRQVKNLVEVLYQSVARSFLLADSLGLSPQTVKRLQDQGSLAHLIHAAERIKKDVLRLMEQAEQDKEVPSATVETQIFLRNEEEREAFVREYVSLLRQLAEKYQAPRSTDTSYQMVLAVYPEPGKEEKDGSQD
ncbi:ArsR/SmtB family transcription factor [Lihuaxuella thermophila]|uniref:Helix-turn-helix domain-containing protein n=1 Tax=Lihuaxuella thermophila TaxID=1173111 RepID=A0A1H8DG28_9BACL|nr:helix-turn-helix domain-containing protein [Lihuaxuella thermophila]SEN05498.1 Helix-turn-helix domain-containing protein [Lihuaxuella thermophila]